MKIALSCRIVVVLLVQYAACFSISARAQDTELQDLEKRIEEAKRGREAEKPRNNSARPKAINLNGVWIADGIFKGSQYGSYRAVLEIRNNECMLQMFGSNHSGTMTCNLHVNGRKVDLISKAISPNFSPVNFFMQIDDEGRLVGTAQGLVESEAVFTKR